MKFWKDNRHWMQRSADESTPTHDPTDDGCEMCGWSDEGGAEDSDLLWSPDFDRWLCMECD